MRRPIDGCLDAAARGTAKPRQPQCHLSEQRRDRVVTIIFHPANSIAAGANRPPDRVLPRLRSGDLALNPREQLFRFRNGQSQIGNIARSSGLLISMMSTQRPSSPAAANFKIHSTPHPRSKNRSENIRCALAPPVLHQSHPETIEWE